MALINIHSTLLIWANSWAKHKGIKGYPSIDYFTANAPKQTSGGVMRFDDDTYIKIDQAVELLRKDNLLQYQVVMAVYVQDVRDSGEFKRCLTALGISKGTFEKKLSEGKRFLSGALSGTIRALV